MPVIIFDCQFNSEAIKMKVYLPSTMLIHNFIEAF